MSAQVLPEPHKRYVIFLGNLATPNERLFVNFLMIARRRLGEAIMVDY